jgi:hypothetical protein
VLAGTTNVLHGAHVELLRRYALPRDLVGQWQCDAANAA